MAKQDVVTAGVSAIQSGEVQVYTDQLGIAYDAGAIDQKASDGTLTQGDLDAAVKAATDPLNVQIQNDALALADAQLQGANALKTLQGSFDELKVKDDALVIKEGGESQSLQNLAVAKEQLQALLVALDAIGRPVVTPDPIPVDPVPAA